MKRILPLIALSLLAGCDIPTPTPGPSGPDQYARGVWSWTLAEATIAGPAPSPKPSGDECDNCGGRGKLGDGVVMVTCPVCNGTGKRINLPTGGDEPPDIPIDEPEAEHGEPEGEPSNSSTDSPAEPVDRPSGASVARPAGGSNSRSRRGPLGRAIFGP